MDVDSLRAELRSSFRWRGADHPEGGLADITGWWRDGTLLRALGPAMAQLVDAVPTVVLAPESRGTLVGSVVAVHLGLGLVELRKDPGPAADDDAWRVRTTPPDYRDRHLRLGFRRDLVRSGDRVLFVDDWIATGGQAMAARSLVDDAGAEWVGAAVIVDGLEFPSFRRELRLRSLLHVREL